MSESGSELTVGYVLRIYDLFKLFLPRVARECSMRGHIRERSPGHWAIVIDIKDQVTGQRKRKWHSFVGNKRAAQVQAAKLIAEAARGTSLDPTKVTIREYFARWLQHMETQVSPRSAEQYGEVVNTYIVPLLGNIQLAKLRAEQIAQAYADALDHGGKNGARLSPRSVAMIHRTLKQGLKQAVDWNLLSTNPASRCRPPRVERKEMKVLDMSTTAALIGVAQGGRLHMPLVLAAFCGVRRGEIAAIRWNRIDLDKATLAISTSIEQTKAGVREKPPKNGRARVVALPAIVVDELRRHRLRQAEDLLRLGVRQSEATHVCLREDASPWPPHLLTSAFIKFIKASGLPRVRLHDLRHGHASHLLVRGVHPKVVQERLGHASISLTLDTYSHLIPSMQSDAAAEIDAALQKVTKGR